MIKVLITGATAFVGSTLADYLIDEKGNIEVHAIRRPRSPTEFVRDEVQYHEGDVTDLAAMMRIVRKVEPDFLFHLAAQSFVPLSWQAPQATLDINIHGTLNILEAVYRESPETIVQFAGSSEEYGMVYPEECPIVEGNPLRPLSPYGASKVAGEMLCQVYHQSYNLKVVTTRAFNHTGPRRGEVFVTSKIAKQLAEIKLQLRPSVLVLGNLEAVRDFTDVRDIVKAYWLLANSGLYATPFNIGSGTGYSIKEVLAILIKISNVAVEIEQDPKLMRPADVPRLICNYDKVKSATGWEPQIPFEQTMKDLFNYWMRKLLRE